MVCFLGGGGLGESGPEGLRCHWEVAADYCHGHRAARRGSVGGDFLEVAGVLREVQGSSGCPGGTGKRSAMKWRRLRPDRPVRRSRSRQVVGRRVTPGQEGHEFPGDSVRQGPGISLVDPPPAKGDHAGDPWSGSPVTMAGKSGASITKTPSSARSRGGVRFRHCRSCPGAAEAVGFPGKRAERIRLPNQSRGRKHHLSDSWDSG